METRLAQVEVVPGASRILAFSGLPNFRDYGGYPVRGGGRLVEGQLYRSSQHRDATEEDLEKVAALGLVAVIDLRGRRERIVAPCPRPDGFTAEVITRDEGEDTAPHEQAASEMTSADDARASMIGSYRRIPFRGPFIALVRAYFETLAAANGPTLVHCAAGKDRTGIAVGLFHFAMGVSWEDTVGDFYLTNHAVDRAGQGALGPRVLRRLFGAHLGDEAIYALMTVEPVYLETAFNAIVEADGSVDAYLRDRVGVDADCIAKLVSKYIV